MTVRIAQISDAHLGASRDPFGPNFDLAAQQIRDARPDLLLTTGDLSLDGADSEADLESAWTRHAGIGIEWRAVPGNHDVGDEAVLGGSQPWNTARAARWHAVAGSSGRMLNHTIRPRQRRAIPATSGSSALSTAQPSRGTASTTTLLTSARSSRVVIPRMPRWSAATLSTTATSLRS